MVNQHLLDRVYLENITNNQIGGLTDGITPEVAGDLGYHRPEDIVGFSSIPELPEDPSEAPDSSEPTNVIDFETAYADAIARGIARAEAFKNDPNRDGADWPSIKIAKAYREEPEASDERTGHKDGKDLSRIDTEEYHPLPPAEKEMQDIVNHAGVAAVREFTKAK